MLHSTSVPVISKHCVSHSYLFIDRLHLRGRLRKFKGNFIAYILQENTETKQQILAILTNVI